MLLPFPFKGKAGMGLLARAFEPDPIPTQPSP